MFGPTRSRSPECTVEDLEPYANVHMNRRNDEDLYAEIVTTDCAARKRS